MLSLITLPYYEIFRLFVTLLTLYDTTSLLSSSYVEYALYFLLLFSSVVSHYFDRF